MIGADTIAITTSDNARAFDQTFMCSPLFRAQRLAPRTSREAPFAYDHVAPDLFLGHALLFSCARVASRLNRTILPW